MVEQPLPAGEDELLAEMDRKLPVCADESCHDRNSLPDLKGKYDMVNIKLDKTGGLTEALALRREAIQQNFEIMTGCMVGTSLAVAPSVRVAQASAFSGLDGPRVLCGDRPFPLRCDDKGVHRPRPELSGSRSSHFRTTGRPKVPSLPAGGNALRSPKGGEERPG